MDDSIKTMLDERAIARLAYDYAEAVDRRNEALLRGTFTADAVLEGPGWRFVGHDQICSIIPILEDSFVSTWHAVHQQTIRIEGDRATGETYSTGRHLQKGGYAENQVVTLTIRYQDSFARTAGGWRISARNEIVDWTESGTIQSGNRQ